jgi:histone H3
MEASDNTTIVPKGKQQQQRTEKKDKKEKKEKKDKKERKERKQKDVMTTVKKDDHSKSVGGIKKPHRYRPGVAAIMEIRRLQTGKKALDKLVPKASMERVLRDLLGDSNDVDISRLQADTVLALHEASEDLLVDLLDKCGSYAKHAGRVTIMPRDMQEAKYDVLPKIFVKHK